MKYFKIKQRENKETIACLEFNNLNSERNLIVGFVADMLQVPIDEADTAIALLIMAYHKMNKRAKAGKNGWRLEVKSDKLYVCKITKESYIEEIEDPYQELE